MHQHPHETWMYPEVYRRIISKISIRGKEECWLWQASLTSNGYGKAWYKGHFTSAHRVVYTLLRGKVPVGLDVMHLCSNRSCCNPYHLKIGTHFENLACQQRRNGSCSSI